MKGTTATAEPLHPVQAPAHPSRPGATLRSLSPDVLATSVVRVVGRLSADAELRTTTDQHSMVKLQVQLAAGLPVWALVDFGAEATSYFKAQTLVATLRKGQPVLMVGHALRLVTDHDLAHLQLDHVTDVLPWTPHMPNLSPAPLVFPTILFPGKDLSHE